MLGLGQYIYKHTEITQKSMKMLFCISYHTVLLMHLKIKSILIF